MVSIAFTGGGTGGHIYPGLAVISRLKPLLPVRVFWIGSNAGMDRGIVESAGIEFFGIPSGKLRRYASLQNIGDIVKVGLGFLAARRILKREKPALLFSKGGFVSVPPCAAAASLGIPVFTHESDVSPGLATRINSRFAQRIFVPYQKSAAFFSGKAKGKVCVSGNPVRPDFSSADPVKGRAFLGLADSDRVLLVLGGSLGSQEINALVWGSLADLTRHYTVVHQTGDAAIVPAEAANSTRYKAFPRFGAEIPHIVAAAEMVLCRSGAGTIWECGNLRKPMVHIPLRGSGTRGDQVENARLFESAGASVCFTGTSPDKLAELINSLADDPEQRKRMAEAEITIPNAADTIADEIVRAVTESTTTLKEIT